MGGGAASPRRKAVKIEGQLKIFRAPVGVQTLVLGKKQLFKDTGPNRERATSEKGSLGN